MNQWTIFDGLNFCIQKSNILNLGFVFLYDSISCGTGVDCKPGEYKLEVTLVDACSLHGFGCFWRAVDSSSNTIVEKPLSLNFVFQ